jgi:Ca-activated chloride channel family protein
VSAEWPGLLWALALVPAALAAYLLAQRRRSRYTVRFTNLDLLANVVSAQPGWRRHVPPAFYLLALAALVISLARPQALALVPKEQATIVLVMDVSGSMNATDVSPTRLVSSQRAATEFIEELPDKFRVGIVSFASTAQTLTRPTIDRPAVYEAVASLRAEGATAMGDGIERALDVKRPPPSSSSASTPGPVRPAPTPGGQQAGGSDAPVVVLLLSDGANTQGRTQPMEAAADAKALGVPVFTIALGTEQGMVDVPDETGNLRRIPVPPDKLTLQRIAETTGGRFFAAPTGDDLEEIYRELGSKIGFVKEKQEITVIFAATGLLFLVAGATMSLTWFSRFP